LNGVTIKGSSISNNATQGSGGGIFVDGGTVTVSNSTITGNNAAVSVGALALFYVKRDAQSHQCDRRIEQRHASRWNLQQRAS
jgi:hypothetical protein